MKLKFINLSLHTEQNVNIAWVLPSAVSECSYFYFSTDNCKSMQLFICSSRTRLLLQLLYFNILELFVLLHVALVLSMSNWYWNVLFSCWWLLVQVSFWLWVDWVLVNVMVLKAFWRGRKVVVYLPDLVTLFQDSTSFVSLQGGEGFLSTYYTAEPWALGCESLWKHSCNGTFGTKAPVLSLGVMVCCFFFLRFTCFWGNCFDKWFFLFHTVKVSYLLLSLFQLCSLKKPSPSWVIMLAKIILRCFLFRAYSFNLSI